MMLRLFVCRVVLAWCVWGLSLSQHFAAEAAPPAVPLIVNSQLQLFLDDWLIDSQQNTRLELHRPRPAEIILARDQPWEDSTLYDPVVIRDGDRYRLWYRTNFNSAPYYTGYAESADGISWRKPSLGLIEFRGSKDNNLVWVGNHSDPNGAPCVLSIFKDTNPATPADERYKATGIVYGGGLKALVSPDGLRWRMFQDERVVPAVGAFDSHNITLWDEARQQYAAYVRGFDGDLRRIRRAVTTDFRRFPVPEFITVENEPRQKKEEFYKNAATPYYRRPDIILMFPKRFLPDRKFDPQWSQPGLSDIVFMFSRDGIRFDRRFHDALIRPGRDQLNWHERAIEVGPGLVPTGTDEMSLYYVEHYRTDSVRIRRGVFRVDGLVSLHADATGGEVVTHPLTFQGKQLSINFSTSAAGAIRIELQDPQGQPLPGFTLADCPPVFGDRLNHVVSWKNGTDVSSLAGTVVRMRIELSEADLYSFQFRNPE